MTRRLASFLAATAMFSTASMFGAAALQAAEDVTITATLANGFSPKNTTVETGTTVVFKNGEAVPPVTFAQTGTIAIKHHVVSSDGALDTGELLPGKSTAITFTEPVELSFVCRIHPQLMSGTLKVQGEPFVPPATEKTIQIVEPSNQTSSWGFNPDELKVTTGTTITWRNTGDTAHTVTADNGSIDSGPIAPGDTFVRTFDNAVALTYKCTPHPWMTGTVIVSKPGEKPPVVVPKPKPRPGTNGRPQPPAAVDSSDREGSEPMTFDAQIVEGSIADPDSWGFAPETLTVRQGDTVRWTNAGSIQHTVTGTGLDSGMLDPGSVYTFTFGQLGTISFACVPHPWMQGAVQVVAVSADTSILPEPPSPDVTTPEVPGGSTADTPGATDGGSTATSGDGADTDAWSLGHVPLAAGTSVALLTVGFLFALPLAHELRKQATQRQAGEPSPVEGSSEPVEPELIEPEIIVPVEPVRRPASKRTPVEAKAPVKRATTTKTTRAKTSEKIVLDETPVRATRSKTLSGTRTR